MTDLLFEWMMRVSFISIGPSLMICFILAIATPLSWVYYVGFATFAIMILCTFWLLKPISIDSCCMCLLFLWITSNISSRVTTSAPTIVFAPHSLWKSVFSSLILLSVISILQCPIILLFLQDASVATFILWFWIAWVICSLNWFS